eukprot:3361069-Alexandrium_andersonii.AAC.1
MARPFLTGYLRPVMTGQPAGEAVALPPSESSAVVELGPCGRTSAAQVAVPGRTGQPAGEGAPRN